REEFFSENYSRLVLNATTDSEGDEAFALVDKVKEITNNYYGDDYYATGESVTLADRKSTRLNSSHVSISYAVFCLKKKKPETMEGREVSGRVEICMDSPVCVPYRWAGEF